MRERPVPYRPALLAGLACVLLAGCARLPRAVDAPRHAGPASPTASLSCTPFQWVDLPGLSDRALIRLPAEVGGRPVSLQLDTGAPETILYDDAGAAEERGWPTDQQGDRTYARAAVRLAGTEVPARVRLSGRNRGPLMQGLLRALGFPVVDGTAGLDLLMGRVTVLDFPSQRLCVVEGAVPAEIERRTAFVPAALRDGKLFVSVEVNGAPVDGLFYDTGASALPVVVDRALWTELTGRTGEDPSDVRMTVSSWGREVPLVGAPALGALAVGPVRAERPVVFYRPDAPGHYAAFPYPATGLVGNAAFWDHVVVLDLRAEGPRFGLYR